MLVAQGQSPERRAIALELRGLSKSFAGQSALRDVSLAVRPREVHALLGQNGSGKSTLIKILAGYHRPDEVASVQFRGEEVSLARHGQRTDWRRHVHFIHQDLALVESLNAVENLALERGFHTGLAGRIDWRQERRRAKALFAEFDVEIDLRLPVGRLGQADRTMVAIIRALQDWETEEAGVLVLDEATVSLSEREVERLFDAIRRVTARGAGVLFVSHRLEEVFEIADCATILRNGRVIGTERVAEIDAEGLIELIVGRRIDEFYAELPEPREDIVLEVEGVCGGVVEGFSLRAHCGEVVGIGGLTGSGRDEVMELLFGARRRTGGRVSVQGKQLPTGAPRAALRVGVGFVPGNRARDGIIGDFAVRENLTLSNLRPLRKRLAGLWRISRRRESTEVLDWIEKLTIRPVEPEQRIATLSGGNQQKVVIARCLRAKPTVLLLDEPTQGVDVGARAQIYSLIADAAREGVCVVLASSHPAELANVCDRVLVMRDGKVVADLRAGALTEARVASETLRVAAAPKAGDRAPASGGMR